LTWKSDGIITKGTRNAHPDKINFSPLGLKSNLLNQDATILSPEKEEREVFEEKEAIDEDFI
jgi:hypothetical protein